MSKLVYLAGKSRAGKDEFAKLWIKHNPSFIRLAFADTIKEMSAKILGVNVDDLSNPETKEKFRAFLIYGGQLGRMIDPNIWVTKLMDSPKYYSDVIITDVRFRNEIHELDYGGYPWWKKDIIGIRIKADDEVRIQRGANPQFFNDISETDLDGIADDEFDYTVVNNGTLDGLEAAVKRIVNGKASKRL